MTDAPKALEKTPFELIGGTARVHALAERFYDTMEETEPALTKLHVLDEQGRVSRTSRDRFAMFLVGWLGGPQDYMREHGHPRLRMRHGRVPVDEAMRDAWVRAMKLAMEREGVSDELRAYLGARFLEVADFLRNTR